MFKPNIEKLKSKSDVTSLCNALQHKNINIRHSAAKALGELGDSEAVDSLINALENDVEEIVRSSSAESLGIIGESHALKHLIEALKDVRVVSNKAYQAIININDAKASEYLRYVTTDDDVHFRRTVAALLRNMKDEEWAVDTLLNLLNDDDKDVSGISKSVLKEIGNPIIKRLINFAETNTLECKKSAVEILDELKWKPKGNAAPWYWVTKRDWRKCVVLGSFAVDALIETVKKEDDVSIRNYAAETLGKIGDERAVQPLIHALKYSDDINYSIFTKALGKIGGSEVVELLISTLKPGSGTTVSTLDAAKALGEIGDPRAVEPLIEALSSSIGKPHIEIAKALANIGDSRAIEPLTYALRDEFDESVFLTLQKIGGTKVIEPFIYRALDNNQGGTRFKQGITSTLREIGTEKAIGYLYQFLQDKDASVRVAAIYNLSSIGDDKAVDAIIGKRWDKDLDVQKSVAKALGIIGNEKVIIPLIQMIKVVYSNLRIYEEWRTYPEEKVLDEAISSLKSFGEPGVDALIESFKKDDDFEARSTFAYVLGELGNPKAIEPLSEALEDTDFVVRTSATKSIEKLKKKKKQTKY